MAKTLEQTYFICFICIHIRVGHTFFLVRERYLNKIVCNVEIIGNNNAKLLIDMLVELQNWRM